MEKTKQFIVWLDGFLDGHETLGEGKTTKLKDKLEGLFDHDAMDAITADKPTLEELGEHNTFQVGIHRPNQWFDGEIKIKPPKYPPFGEGLHGEGPDDEKMRC
jgi:hypothetical protein